MEDGNVVTHPANEHILNGISRQIVIKLCRKLEIPVIEKPVTENEIKNMDEAFFTGTTTQVASIAQLGNHVFYKNDAIGEVTARLQKAFAELRTMDSSQITL